METQIDLKKLGVYLIIPLIVSLALMVEQGTFVLIGVVEFFIGAIQVLVAFVKTIIYLFNKEVFPQVLKFYWIAVLIYFVVGSIGALALNYLEIDEEIVLKVGLIYFSLAWSIAVYHFKHIMLLKL